MSRNENNSKKPIEKVIIGDLGLNVYNFTDVPIHFECKICNALTNVRFHEIVEDDICSCKYCGQRIKILLPNTLFIEKGNKQHKYIKLDPYLFTFFDLLPDDKTDLFTVDELKQMLTDKKNKMGNKEIG